MSAMGRLMRIVTLLGLQVYNIQGLPYSLSGSTSFGIRGEDYRFTCQISGGHFLPTDTFVFYKGVIPVCTQPITCSPGSPTDTRYTCGCINGDPKLLYLNITNVQSTDAGEWRCGFKVNWDDCLPVALPVYYGPENIRFTPPSSSITLRENESRTVTGSVDCFPQCDIKWFKGGETVSSGSDGLLSLNNIQRQQAGNYTFQVTNTQIPGSLQSKQLMVTVHYVPDESSNINSSPPSHDTICITWTPGFNGGDQQEFIVQHSVDNKTWTSSTPLPQSKPDYCIKNLQADTPYYIRVIARNKYGDSQPVYLISSDGPTPIQTAKMDETTNDVKKRWLLEDIERIRLERQKLNLQISCLTRNCNFGCNN